jgi:hypothetical protein
MFDGDPQARVKDRDRDRATYVVDAALRNRQITQQDRDLRLERIRSAATVGELDGLVHDLVTAPAPVPATAVVPPPTPATTPAPPPPVADPYAAGSPRPTAPVPSDLYGPPRSTKKSSGSTVTLTSAHTGRKAALGCLGVAVLFFIGPIIAGVAFFAGSTGGSDSATATDPIPAGPPFELTHEGIRDYLTTFEDAFGDSQVVRAVFYDGYVVTWVPAGGDNVAIWNYRNGAFEQLGDPMDGAGDTAPVDLADLRPGKVMSLVQTARETLGVPEPYTTYVIYDRSVIGNDPQVAVYLNNSDTGDSGFLWGDVNGKVISTQAAD